MPFPATLTLVTVAIQWDLPPDGGARGHVDFEAPYPLLGAADGSIIPPFRQRAHLTAAGTGSIQLPATNDPQWSPTGWAYTVTARIGGQTITGTLQLDYQTTSVQLADLLQVDGTAVAGTSYILTSQRSVASGVAALDADGDVIDADGNKVGGSGAINETIVNTKGDLIVATAADTVTRFAAGTDGQYLRAASSETAGLQYDTLTASDVSDSTTVGRAVLTATDAAAGRTAIDAEASGAASSAVSTHVGLPDPHSQYALEANLGDAALLDVGTTTGTVAAGDDTRITGALQRATGGTVTADVTVADNATPTKAYRFKVSGGSLDLDAAGEDLYLSAYPNADFTGTQRTYARYEADTQLAHLLGRHLFAAGAFDGTGVADLDPSTGVAAIGAKNSLTNVRFCGLKATSGAPSTDTWTTGDVVLDSAGAWHLCTAGGTPGTWTTPSSGGSSITLAHGYITTGDVTPQTTASWAVMTDSPTFSIAAVEGDVVTVDWTALIDPVSAMFLDLAVIVSGTVTKYAATGTSSNGIEGDPGLYPDVPAFHPSRGYGMTVTCASGDLDGGNITFGFAVINPNGGGKLYASTNYPLRYRIVNHGQ